jgi:hypothetical protein
LNLAKGLNKRPPCQALTPSYQVQAAARVVVGAAFEVDPTGDFGNLVLPAAATGARFSQLANLSVADFQFENCRLMMPSSRKGKNRQPGAHVAVPVGIDVMRRMLPIIEGREESEPLLLRWSYRKTGGPGNWTKDKRQAWRRAYEIDDLWAKTIVLAGINVAVEGRGPLILCVHGFPDSGCQSAFKFGSDATSMTACRN